MSNDANIMIDDSFEAELQKTDKPVLAVFGAVWCGPCKMMSPLVDAMATEYKDKLFVAKINVDKNPETTKKYGIRSTPSLLFFKDRKTVAQKAGAMSRSQLKAFIDANL